MSTPTPPPPPPSPTRAQLSHANLDIRLREHHCALRCMLAIVRAAVSWVAGHDSWLHLKPDMEQELYRCYH